MTEFKAVVFDMDGVLIDSKDFIVKGFTDVLSARGIAVSPQQVAAIAGKPVAAMYEILAPGSDSAELTKAHFASHAKNMHLMAAFADTITIMEELKPRYKLGVFTGYDERSWQRLAQFGLDKYVDVLADSSRYHQHKPNPEGLLLCLGELGVSPAEAVYVGDATNDIEAGQAAKMGLIVGITQGFGSRQELEAAGADYVIDSLTELPPLLETNF